MAYAGEIIKDAADIAVAVDPALAPAASVAVMLSPVIQLAAGALMGLFHHKQQAKAAAQGK